MKQESLLGLARYYRAHEAEDAVQDALVTALEKGKLNEPSYIKTCVMHKAGLQKLRAARETDYFHRKLVPAWGEPDEFGSVEAQMDVLDAMKKLSPVHRQAIVDFTLGYIGYTPAVGHARERLRKLCA